MEAELESKEPTETGDDASSSEDEGDRGAAMTLVEHHEPMVAPISGGRGMETLSDVPESRKHVMSEDTALERESKQAQAPCPSEVLSASQPPALSVTEHAGRSGKHDCPPVPSGSPRMHGPQWGDAPPIAPVVSL